MRGPKSGQVFVRFLSEAKVRSLTVLTSSVSTRPVLQQRFFHMHGESSMTTQHEGVNRYKCADASHPLFVQ